jgi:outer membrane protein
MKLTVALLIALLGITVSAANGEVRTMTLRQVIDMALSQSPEVMLTRLDQQKARSEVTIQRDPFIPKISAGSGLAYTSGFPTSIDGNAPSILQAKVSMAIFNRPQSYLAAQANEGVRGAAIDVARKQDEVVYRVASLYLDAEQLTRSLDAARRQNESLLRVKELMDQRVAEGRELPIEGKKANLAALRATQSIDALTFNLLNAETSLGLALGLSPDDRVHPAQEERAPLQIPVSEESSVEQALQSSNELKGLQSNIQAKLLEIKSYQAAKLPKINLVAQYSLLGKYNNYEQYFSHFQRNNGEIGASIEIPIMTGRAPDAQQTQTQADIAKLRIQLDQARSRITADLRLAYQNLKRAESARDLARADLDVTREELNVALAQMDEGRLPLARVEALRATENEKFLTLYDAQHAAELARFNVLRQTGTLEASIH